jgi:hypothetical protein
LKERTSALIQSIKNRNVESETERHILSRLKVHAKKEFDDEYHIVKKMVENNSLLPYVWVEQQWPPEIGDEYIRRKNVVLDPQTEALRGDENTPYLTYEQIHRAMKIETSMRLEERECHHADDGYQGPEPPSIQEILEVLPDYNDIIANKAKVIEMLHKQLRDEETTPSHNCFKKLTEEYIEKYILDLPEFGQFITAKDPIGLYKALQNKYLVATHDDIARAQNALNETVMKDNENFQQFKRRWDNAMINYMMVECRTPIIGDSTRHMYP